MSDNLGNRRSERQRSFVNREFSRISVRSNGLAGMRANERFCGFLAAANLRFDRLADTTETVVQVAQFPDLTVAYGKLPQGKVVWPRDDLSLDRAAVVMTARGRVAPEGAGIVGRKPGAFFIPPGSTTVSLSFEASVNELVYASIPASLVADIPLPENGRRFDEEINAFLLDPIYRFMAGLAHSPVRDRGMRPARYATGEMLRALVHLIARAPETELPLFERATQEILQELGDHSLSADTLAPRLGTSSRRLQLEFQRHGTTVQREIRRMRTEAARLMRRENPDIDMRMLVRAFGFGSRSSLYRALSEEPESAAAG